MAPRPLRLVLAALGVELVVAGVANGDDIPEKMLGETTKGTCGTVDIPIPGAPDIVMGRCYEFRNAVCKAGKCRCLKGQELSDDGEFCVNPGHCSKHTAKSCDAPGLFSGGGGATCPSWTEGAFCDKNNQCTCGEGECAVVAAPNDPWSKCRKPGKEQTCNKMTGGTCMMAQIGHQLTDALSEATGGLAGKAAGKIGSFVAKQAVGSVSDMSADGLKAMIRESKSAKHDGLASLAGTRTKEMPSMETFGEGSSCDGWRDAVCSYPILDGRIAGVDVANTLDSVQDSVLGSHGSKSADCMCRPTDCSVYSTKHKGLACIYGPLLSKLSEVQEEVSLEDVTRHAYQNLTQALYGSGADDHADFFTHAHRDMLRDFYHHHECIEGMHAGVSPDEECRHFVCGFASVASGHFPRAWWLCSTTGSFMMMIGSVLVGSMAIVVAATWRWKAWAKTQASERRSLIRLHGNEEGYVAEE